MKKLVIICSALILTGLMLSSSFATIVRSPDPLDKGASEFSLNLAFTPAQGMGSNDTVDAGFGYEYGVTDLLGIKGILGSTSGGGDSSNYFTLGADYAIQKDSPNGFGVSLQGSILKPLVADAGDFLMYSPSVVIGKRMGQFYPFCGLGLVIVSNGSHSLNEWELNVATKYNFTANLNAVINYNFICLDSKGGDNAYQFSGSLAYTL